MSEGTRTLIIAEAGVNHDGDGAAAVALVDAAAEAGADALKLQTFRTQLLVSDDAPQAPYQRERSPAASQAEMLRRLELDADAHRAVAKRCAERGIEFLSTPFDPPSLSLLMELDVQRLKVASGELTNGPMLLRMARTGLPLIVSTGMATLDEVADALAIIAWGRGSADGVPTDEELARERASVLAGDSVGLGGVTVLHCTSSYPTDPSHVNLRAMQTLSEGVHLPVGYSDHTVGDAVAIAAVARGAVVIEKHLTLDRSRPGPDHAASIDPGGFAALVRAIREVEMALGDRTKQPSPSELAVRDVARRSVVAARAVRAGTILTEEDLVALRPGGGLPPNEVWRLIGTRATRDLLPGEFL